MYRSCIIAKNWIAALSIAVAFFFITFQVTAPLVDANSYFSMEGQGSARESAKFKAETILPALLFSFLTVVLRVVVKIDLKNPFYASSPNSAFQSLPIGYSCIGLSPP